MINQLLIILFAYLVGSVSSGIIISQIFNLPDPRTIGSKNPGATNVMRSGNKKAAFFTLLGDLLKAILVLAIAEYLGFNDFIIVCVALAVLIGHIYPIFYKFRGGKGVATAIGILIALNFKLALYRSKYLAISFWYLALFLISSNCGSYFSPYHCNLYIEGSIFILHCFHVHHNNNSFQAPGKY